MVGSVSDRLVGDPTRRHPVATFGRVAAELEGAVWRPSHLVGVAYAGLLIVATSMAAWWVDRSLRDRPAARTAFVAVVVWAALGGKSLRRAARDLARAVEDGDLQGARMLAPNLVGRDPSELDGSELCRAAVESVAENTADAVVGPLFWTAVGGPAATVAYRAANTLDAMVGHRSEHYEAFGWAAARLDDVATWLPARLATLLAVAFAPVANGDRVGAWRTLRRDGRTHPSPNAGRLETAFAGALGVRLGGTNRYGTRVEIRPELGDGDRPLPRDVERAVRLADVVGAAATLLAFLWAWWWRP
jgi:adenosylcobinamide-phosphate synthase